MKDKTHKLFSNSCEFAKRSCQDGYNAWTMVALYFCQVIKECDKSLSNFMGLTKNIKLYRVFFVDRIKGRLKNYFVLITSSHIILL